MHDLHIAEIYGLGIYLYAASMTLWVYLHSLL